MGLRRKLAKLWCWGFVEEITEKENSFFWGLFIGVGVMGAIAIAIVIVFG